jgi:ATP-dependent DNA helicase RecQ
LQQPEDILKKYFGYDQFRPLQKDIVLSILSGKDTIALLPTGGGKSVCFQVPALMSDGLCIVITPLIALMKDQVENLRNKDIPAIALHSAMSRKEIEFELENCVNGIYKFLYISPERLLSRNFREYAIHMKLSFLAIDEAHCISQWGYDFRPPYLQIPEFKNLFPGLKTIALTASATPEVVIDLGDKLEMQAPAIFNKSFSRSNLSYVVEETESKYARIIDICKKLKGTGLVYVKSRKKTHDVAKYLNDNGLSSDYYHAGLDANIRTQKQDDWKNNKIRIMVCTNAFGMGIDKPDVRFVIHEQKPDTMEAYYQEAGRAGRDGNKSFCILLHQNADFEDDAKQLSIKYPEPKEIARIYELIFNYLNIAVGSGAGTSCNFDVMEFCNYYKLKPNVVFNCIRILENEAYFQTSDAMYIPSRIKILVNYEELYNWQLKHESIDAITKVILRSYGGVFDFYTSISEYDISKRVFKPDRWVKEQLNQMKKMDLIDYIPQNDKPQLYLIENRFNSISISNNKMEFLKNRYKSKLEFMNQYTRNQTICRSIFLVNYFGEKLNDNCGICDVCLNNKKNNTIDNNFDAFYLKTKDLIQNHRITLQSLREKIYTSDLDNYLIALRYMIDNDEVVEEPSGEFKWNKKEK